MKDGIHGYSSQQPIHEKDVTVRQQELLRKERSLQQAISCLRDRKRFASSDRMESEVAFVADLYNLTPDEVAKAMDGEEYWCN